MFLMFHQMAEQIYSIIIVIVNIAKFNGVLSKIYSVIFGFKFVSN